SYLQACHVQGPATHSGPMTKNPVADPGWLSFDIHGRVRMGVARSAPAAAQLRTMFADFLTDESDGPFDLTVTGEMQPVHGAAYAEDTFSYTPSAICLRMSELHQSAMAARMLGNFHIEMTVHSREVLNLLGATGLVPL